MTLLEDLEDLASDAERRQAHGYARRFREYAERLRSEMHVRADDPLITHVLRVINGGPLK